MIGTPGWRAFSADTIRCAGATQCLRNSDGDSTPAQESNSISASAPATTWADKYSIDASVRTSINRWNTAGWL